MYVCTGDSTSRQKLQALECELIREDKRVKVGKPAYTHTYVYKVK